MINESIYVCNKLFQNRVVLQPMEGCDCDTNGSPSELTVNKYIKAAKSSAGTVWFEATAVSPEGRTNPRQMMLTKDNIQIFKDLLTQMRDVAKRECGISPVFILQLTHSGRQSIVPMVAYRHPIYEEKRPVTDKNIVTDEYLDTLAKKYADSALLAVEAGFDGVDVKSCHGYLIQELLSAFNREGKYGGSLENRTRLLRESIEGAIQRTSGDFIVSSRINAYDGFEYPYGFGVREGCGIEFDSAEPSWLIDRLYGLGVRILNVTMGNPYFNPHVNRPFAKGGYEISEHPLEGVKRMLHGTAELKAARPEMKLICSALSYLGVAAPNVAAAFIQKGGFDLAGFGRTIFAYPDFASDVIKTGGLDREKICICCSKCSEIMRTSGGTPGCVIRDREVYLPIYKEKCME